MKTYNTSTEAESAVLGAIMLDYSVGMFACQREGVTVDTFTEIGYQKIYGIMQLMAEQNRPIDMLTVSEELSRNNISMDIISLGEIMESVATAHHIEYYIEIIKEKQRIRNIERNAMAAVQACQQNVPSHEIAGRMMEQLTDQNRRLAVKKLTDLRDDKISQWRKAIDVGFVGIPSGFHYVNQYLGGYRRGVNTIIGGFRGEGKSTLLRQEALSIAKAGIPVLLVSLEDPADVAAAGIVGNHGDFSVFQHDIGHGSGETLQKAEQAWNSIGDLPLFITNDSMNITQLASTVTALKAAHDIQVVIVDHLQYILSSRRFPSRNDEISYFSQCLCSLWRRLNIAGLTLSQFSRSAERENREPRLSDLRDSGSIEQDARAVMLLFWDGDNSQHILKIAKNNYGPSGAKIIMKRVGNRQRFDEMGIIEEIRDDTE